MKKAFLFCIVFFSLYSYLSAQQVEQPNSHFRFGFGLGIGFFYPSDVNDFISADLRRNHGSITTWNEELYMNIVGSVSLIFSPSSEYDLIGTLEYAWAPKFVTGSNISEYYHFDRISPGILANYNIPFKSGQHSIFIGAGVLFHSMSIESMNGTTLGPRIQAGVNLRFGKVNPQVGLSYDYAVATAGNQKKLNYSGVLINIKANF